MEVAVVPLRSEPGIQFEFAMAAGVRFGDRESRAQLEDLLARTADETAALFAEYHIPLIDEPAELVYVTNEDAGTISVISTATRKVIGEIEVGTRPRGVEVSRDGELVYVALSGSPKCPPTMPDEECAKLGADKTKDGIAVIDARRQAVLRVLPGGSDPEEFDVDAASGRLFVANEDAGELSIVDLATGRVLRTVDVGGEPEGVRLRPDRADRLRHERERPRRDRRRCRQRSACSAPFRSAGARATRFSPPTARVPTCRRSTAAA